jgi:uncharacterized protein YoxC
MDLEHEKRLTKVEERSKSNQHRLDKLEPIVEEIHNMSETLVEMTTEMKHTNKSIEGIKDKVESMEQEPAKRWKDSTKAIFNAFLGAIGTAAAGALIYILTLIQ